VLLNDHLIIYCLIHYRALPISSLTISHTSLEPNYPLVNASLHKRVSLSSSRFSPPFSPNTLRCLPNTLRSRPLWATSRLSSTPTMHPKYVSSLSTYARLSRKLTLSNSPCRPSRTSSPSPHVATTTTPSSTGSSPILWFASLPHPVPLLQKRES
jgi:hypothetical protein